MKLLYINFAAERRISGEHIVDSSPEATSIELQNSTLAYYTRTVQERCVRLIRSTAGNRIRDLFLLTQCLGLRFIEVGAAVC